MIAAFYFDEEEARNGVVDLRVISICGKEIVYNYWNQLGFIPDGCRGVVFEGSYKDYQEICTSIKRLPKELNPFMTDWENKKKCSFNQFINYTVTS